MKKINLPILFACVAFFGTSQISAQDYSKVLKSHFANSSANKVLQNSDFVIDNVDQSTSMNAAVVKIQQSYDGIPIYGQDATALVRNSNVLNVFEGFKATPSKVSSKSTAKTDREVITAAISKLQFGDVEHYFNLLSKNETTTPKLYYYNTGSELKLGYLFEVEDLAKHELYSVLADASTGDILNKVSVTHSCSFGPETFGRAVDAPVTVAYPQLPQQSSFKPYADDSSYRVYAFPTESPSFGDRTLVSNPWNVNQSPYGWHRDGTTEYTISRGNNVYAYLDEMSTNTIGAPAEGGASKVFDFPLNFANGLNSYRNAAITNLFYANNMIHDLLYKYGFTETSKNFQAYNFGKGGNQNDYVLAEARDGAMNPDLSLGYYNNANFSTPADGSRGRMQMYIWLGDQPYFFYNSPSNLSGTSIPQIGLGYFGQPIWAAPTTGDVKLASILDACEALPAGSLAGKIGLAQRGTCNFTVKVKNMEDAGAIGAIIFNSPDAATNPGEAISNMSGDGTVINITSVFVAQSKGEEIISLLNQNQTVNVTLKANVLDGSLDNGIIAHEYGHGLSSRMTGTNTGCLNSNVTKEQMGEGWSDFVGLLATLKPTDNANTPRGIATYVFEEPNDGTGLRPARYSPDFAYNNYTYGKTNGMEYTNSNGVIVPNVHSIGFVWATILWDLHWKYVEKYGFNSNLLTDAGANSGSGKVLQTVINGIKTQPCYPTFISGRDAIIAADQAMTGGENKCLIWNTFAKRGVGLNASAGSSTNINDQVEDFTVPTDCILATNNVDKAALSIYPNPAKNEFNLKLPTNTKGKVVVEVYDATGRVVLSQRLDAASSESINTTKLTNGKYVVKVSGIGVESSTKLIINK